MRLIDADAIVEIAKNSYNTWNLAMAAAESNREINKVFKMQELCKAVKQVAECLPTIAPKPQWIPVSERLPEKYEDVLISYRIANEKAARIWIGYRAEMGWCAYEVYHPNVTAWMPLPEPYDPEEEKMGDAE